MPIGAQVMLMKSNDRIVFTSDVTATLHYFHISVPISEDVASYSNTTKQCARRQRVVSDSIR